MDEVRFNAKNFRSWPFVKIILLIIMFEENKGSLKKGTLLNSSYKSKDYVDWNETEVCEWLANDVNFP